MPTLKIFTNFTDHQIYASFSDASVLDLPDFIFGDTGLTIENHAIRTAAASDTGQPFEYIPASELVGCSEQIGLGKIDQASTGGTGHLIDPDTRATSGLLVSGARYYIEDYNAGDSFTNVGAGSNATGVIFTASGTTPTTWTNLSTLIQICDAIAYNALDSVIQTAIRVKMPTNYSAATVTGDAVTLSYPWIIDRVTAGNVSQLEGIGTSLTPESFVRVDTMREGDAFVSERQRVQFIQRPAAYADTSTQLPTYTTISATQQRQGTANRNEIQRFSLPRDTYGGVWSITATDLGSSHTDSKSTGNIQFGQSGVNIQAIINAAFGATNVVVVTVIDLFTIDIEFTGTDVDLRDATLMTADISGLQVPTGFTTDFSLNTSSAASLLSGVTEISLTFEIQFTDASSKITTLYQNRSATLLKDLISPASTGSTEFPGYYTTAAIDAIIAGLFDDDSVSVSTSGDTEVTIPEKCKWFTFYVTVGAGSGSYTRNIDLPTTNRVAGDKCEVKLSMPASSNPIIVVRDNSPATLYTETSSGVAYVRPLWFTWNGTAWTSDQGSA